MEAAKRNNIPNLSDKNQKISFTKGYMGKSCHKSGKTSSDTTLKLLRHAIHAFGVFLAPESEKDC